MCFKQIDELLPNLLSIREYVLAKVMKENMSW